MRPGRPPGGANLADHTATRHLLPDLHINLRHVAEHADKALPMVDKHRVAIKEVVTDQNHLARALPVLIGVPAPTAKSRPEWMLYTPLKKRRTPSLLDSGPLTQFVQQQVARVLD